MHKQACNNNITEKNLRQDKYTLLVDI